MAALLFGGCQEEGGGNTVAVVIHHGPARNGHVTLASVELQACSETAWTVALISKAHAHSEGSPTRIGDTTVLRLGESPTAYGSLHPPDGSYCSVEVGFGPADADARGLEGSGMEGLTFTLDGYVGSPSIEVTEAFDAAMLLEGESAVTLNITLTLPGGFADALAAHQALRRAVRLDVRSQ